MDYFSDTLTSLLHTGHLETLPSQGMHVGSNEKSISSKKEPEAATYLEVFSDRKTCILCFTGFFFQYVYCQMSIELSSLPPEKNLFSHHFCRDSFANANVLLVLGELMGGDDDDGGPKRSAIPLIAGAIVTAQITMAAATLAGDRLTEIGIGRKPLFTAALLSLPIRCALIIWLQDKGDAFLLATQVLDGIGGGLFGLIHPYLIADITFGTGRFNVISAYLSTCLRKLPQSSPNFFC